ncbi:MAG: LacI family DNA-binding transcriptional regulator [Reichenbachiella sp.]|uniref:LacI family DNA-binding transcriptional regulator n=1 Tax=Reichenbachiella sp. TaxID=2184521 RepID=UPI00296636F0|nr:LacI family DNA-binding transcriptional regulator [Reichenbachiella sp.]MDW3212028.1 LacI family DNA-binding transcriptional regulator [Reichenbachiella sp.]
MKKKITIHDLARILNKDSSTISRALANSPRVKKKTRDLIQAKAKELGYFRNTLASNLRSQKSLTIGVIVPHISRYFFSTAIAGIEEIAFENNYRVIIGQSMDQLEKERQLVETLLSSQVDGILMSISMETNAYDHLERVAEQKTPIVFFDRKCEAIPANNILIDDHARAFDATEHLILSGRTRIAHFSGLENVSIYEDRQKGYKEALRKHNIAEDPDLIFKSSLKSNDGKQLADQILNLRKKPDAIFCANDIAAIACMQVLQEAGIRIPQDIAIVGFSNEPLGEYTTPSLSSINQNPLEMGKTAVQTLLNQIEGPQAEHQTKYIDSELIIRNSSGRQ